MGGGGGNAEGSKAAAAGTAGGGGMSGNHRPERVLAQVKEAAAGAGMAQSGGDANSTATGQPNWRNVSATPTAGFGLTAGSDMAMVAANGTCAAAVQLRGERVPESTLSPSNTKEAGADLTLR